MVVVRFKGTDAPSDTEGGAGAKGTTVKATAPKVRGWVITTSVTAPAAGTAVLTASPVGVPRAITCTSRRTFKAAGTATLRCTPGAAVRLMRRTKPVRVQLRVVFRPKAGGAAQTLTLRPVTLSKLPSRPEPVTG